MVDGGLVQWTFAEPVPPAGSGKNREALMEAAIRCLSERGYARTTSRDLAAAAGANLAAITYHYGSKDELLDQALVEGFRRWFETLLADALAAGEQSDTALLLRLARALEASFETNRGLALAFLEALAQAERSPNLRRQLTKSYRNARAGLGPLLAEALALDEREAADLASGMIAIADGLLMQWLVDPQQTPPVTAVLSASLAAAQRQLATATT
jgi:AcrR family transcriptional regulator